ncbi:MAG: bifunctional UDP-N-acetylglucosamine diphosphorylase/glucosamine-1-phosphate N-acetyltransferase GlmU [Parvibaculum sp.]
MSVNDTTVVILAAGKGTRMKSALPKVLHPLANRPLLGHVIDKSLELGAKKIITIVAPSMEEVSNFARSQSPLVVTAIQKEPKGTGDAARASLAVVPDEAGTVLVLFGDAALLETETLRLMRQQILDGAQVVVLGFEAEDPTNYGRLVCGTTGALTAIVEEKDASDEERRITLCNGGAMAIDRRHFRSLLEQLKVSGASGEVYLTEVPELAAKAGLACAVVTRDEDESMGVDSRLDLASAEKIFQTRRRNFMLSSGVTMRDPESVFFSADTIIGRDTLIEPNVVFGPGVRVGEDVTIKAFSHLEGAIVENKCDVGPFARLRPGTKLGVGAKVGNFVETKKADIEAGAKISHLTYIGDARVGAEANIGAGTITCNYDGFNKHFTDIGAGAFIGSNSSLVAPVKIGDGANVGAGSVITKDVAADALAVARGRQMEKAGWGASFRKNQSKLKDMKD